MCTVRVDTTDSRVFVENATGAIAVTIQDYARKLLVLKEEDDIKIPYVHVISQVTVQVKQCLMERYCTEFKIFLISFN